jgi:ABC-type multidrug transport system fused ATPase/permease subunit
MASVFQILLSFLDLAGVIVIGVLGSLTVNGVQSKKPGNRVESVLNFLHLDGNSFQFQAAALGVLAAVLLMSRTLLSVFFSRRTMFFLSRRGANISSTLLAKLLNQSYLNVNARSVQETIFSIMSGVSILTLVVLGSVITLLSDLSLLVVLTVGLIAVDVRLAILTFILFVGIALCLYFALHKKVYSLGNRQANLSISINEKISEILTSYRENIVRGRRSFYAKEISVDQISMASVQAELSFIPNISKYVIEGSLVLGTLIICAIQFQLQDASRAVGTLSIFLAAGSRIAPAVLRIQQSALALRNASGIAKPTMDLIESLSATQEISPSLGTLDFEYKGFVPRISLDNIQVRYPNTDTLALRNVNLEINPGETIAIVGPSGAGKTTLVDVILGVLEPTAGEARISNLSPDQAVAYFPGAIAYVPQDVYISNGTILENVVLGYGTSEVQLEYVNRALRVARLKELISSLPEGLDSLVGERGTKISGGQRQRLGIARALYTQPKLLVLDEATSALDGQTEADISNSIKDLKGSVTVLIIAHRLSTVKHADRVYYLEQGEIKAVGSFDQVRSAVPDFDAQAKLMGL